MIHSSEFHILGFRAARVVALQGSTKVSYE